MKRYELSLPDFYSMKTTEFIKIFNSLKKDCDVLTKHQIFINDLSARNTMSYKDKLKVVDYDLYRRSTNPKLDNTNNKMFLWLWHDIFMKQRIINGYKKIIRELDIAPFFNPSSGNIEKVQEKLLSNHLVIDSFIKG